MKYEISMLLFLNATLLGYRIFHHVFFFKLGSQAQMRCSAEDNHNMVYMHVWKAAGYSLMENLKAIGSNYEAGPPASTIFFFNMVFRREKKGSISWMRNSDGFFEVVDSFEDDFNWCENINLVPRPLGAGASLGRFLKSQGTKPDLSVGSKSFAGEVRLIPLVGFNSVWLLVLSCMNLREKHRNVASQLISSGNPIFVHHHYAYHYHWIPQWFLSKIPMAFVGEIRN